MMSFFRSFSFSDLFSRLSVMALILATLFTALLWRPVAAFGKFVVKRVSYRAGPWNVLRVTPRGLERWPQSGRSAINATRSFGVGGSAVS